MNRNCRTNSKRWRQAFTLIELLAVLAIVSLLLSLSAVGLGQVRERARLLSCSNRIRQVALAVRLHESRERSLPSLMVGDAEASCWFALANDLCISLDLSAYTPVYTNENIPTFVPEGLLCPSEHGAGANYRFNVGSTLSWQPKLNYIVPDAGNGVMVVDDNPLILSEISDGLSQTALVSERLSGDGYDSERRSIAIGPHLRDLSPLPNQDLVVAYLQANFSMLNKTHDGGRRWTTGMWKTIGYNHVVEPQSKFAGTFNRGNGLWCNFGCVPPTSSHPSGVSLATCDGAVRTVSESIDLFVWKALGTRAASD